MYTKSSQYNLNDVLFMPDRSGEEKFFKKIKNSMLSSCMSAEDIITRYGLESNCFRIYIPYYYFRLSYRVKVEYIAYYIKTRFVSESVKKRDEKGKTIIVNEVKPRHEKDFFQKIGTYPGKIQHSTIATDLTSSIDKDINTREIISFIVKNEVPFSDIKYSGQKYGNFKMIPFGFEPHEFKNQFDNYVGERLLDGIKLQGDGQRDVNVQDFVSENLECLGLYNPFMIYTYRYKDKQYVIIMNCFNGKTYNNGKPRNLKMDGKLALNFAGIYVAGTGLILCLIVLYSFVVGMNNSVDWINVLENKLTIHIGDALFLPILIGSLYVGYVKSSMKREKSKIVNKYCKEKGLF
ncbi:hypothetical protein V7O61_04070 [Methanolobus sp. WCC1]|uniref:hypothetical protein n=1 Tax=Methanolobus sp. WCC1 TaxID=3125782 RepID=UPI00324EE489